MPRLEASARRPLGVISGDFNGNIFKDSTYVIPRRPKPECRVWKPTRVLSICRYFRRLGKLKISILKDPTCVTSRRPKLPCCVWKPTRAPPPRERSIGRAIRRIILRFSQRSGWPVTRSAAHRDSPCSRYIDRRRRSAAYARLDSAMLESGLAYRLSLPEERYRRFGVTRSFRPLREVAVFL